MVKKISEKTSGISLAGFQPKPKVFDGQTPSPATKEPVAILPARETVKPFTGAGAFMNSITGKDEVAKELADSIAKLEDANKEIAKFAGATLVRKLDPNLVKRSQWANRNEAEFSTAEFEELKADIAAADGNVQPIKVRVAGVFDSQTHYEIVFGHRRHQACLILGIRVNAVIQESMTDLELFEEMDRENRARKSLSAWEQGRMYQDALTKGLYPSLRKLAESLNVNVADASRSVDLAKLPKVVVDAFATPLDLQVRWSKPLKDALQKNPDSVLATAKEISSNKGGLSPVEVFERLIGKIASAAKAEIEIKVQGKRAAVFRIDAKGRSVLEFEAGVLPSDRQKTLISLVEDFLAA
jgi:ParB family transcriptional regulator, chromosome partitioning protein